MTLRYGMRGEAVRRLQKELKKRGYYGGRLDGDYGPKTRKAVKAFQLDEHLTVDGVAGHLETLPALGLDKKPASPDTIVEVLDLDLEAKVHMIETMSVFEGNPDSMNKDWEFGGWFDQPRKTLDGKKLHPKDRKRYAEENNLEFDPNGYSRYGDNPGHVGLSFGFIQFTQSGGALGDLLAAMRKKHPVVFDRIFGPDSAELVRVTNMDGPWSVVPDADSPTGKARRNPRVQPVGGADLWKQPWLSRFEEAGNHDALVEVQYEQAVTAYFDRMLVRTAIPFDVRSQKGLTILMDRSVQLGVSGCGKLMERYCEGMTGLPEWEMFEHLYSEVRTRGWSHRLRKLIDSDEVSWYTRYKW
jgi:peptidoglycan hydrolase-like protein with peptidoglycan-binding domain